MTTEIVTDALMIAWFRRRPETGVRHHSDRGSQYATHAFQGTLKDLDMIPAMSRKASYWDNAPTESWFNNFKNERYHGVRYATHAEMKAASLEYIAVFIIEPVSTQRSAIDPRFSISITESMSNGREN